MDTPRIIAMSEPLALNHPASPLLKFDLEARRSLARSGADPVLTPFAALADGLARELEPLEHGALPIPERKARLTRFGGRCPQHGTLLEFDPWQPHAHWCLRCGRPYHDVTHDEWWAMGAQLWTAERAVHAAALYALRGEPRHGALAARILHAYTERYHQWPNADNVLGPSRPFFSTYLESIWLLNLCHAVALLESVPGDWSSTDASALRERVLAPSAALIEGYHEGGSNRQVWNEVALSSAWCLLGREREVRGRLDRDGGLRWHIRHGLDDNGAWYEGENYHLFAHRGLWYGVQLMRALDEPLAPDLNARYTAGFVAPFAGLLPDETFPSRRDSQYASSIRQWRTAEWCELGWAHSHDARIAAVLSRLYDGTRPRRETGRSCSMADAERNGPATALTRADLSWRALLMADPMPAPTTGMPLASVCLPAQGLSVIRRDAGRTYVALEGGELGGGHGHPDQLALTLQTDGARWLDDPGTGSYVEPTLRWYRSTLAHAAPLFDRTSQRPVPARLIAFSDREGHTDGMGWIAKRVDGIAPGVSAERTIIVGDGYLVDVLEWNAESCTVIELPIAGHAEPQDAVDDVGDTTAAIAPSTVARGDQLEAFLEAVRERPLYGTVALRAAPTYADVTGATAQVGGLGTSARVWYAVHAERPDEPATLVTANVPAAPWRGQVERRWIRASGTAGRIVGVWSWPTALQPDGGVASVQLWPAQMPCARVTTIDGAVDLHQRDAVLSGAAPHGPQPRGWHVTRVTASGQRVIELAAIDPAMIDPAMIDPATIDPSTAVSAPDRSSHRAQQPTPVRPTIAVARVNEAAAAGAPGSLIVGATPLELGESHYVRTEPTWAEAGSPTAFVQLAVSGDELIVDVTARTGTIVVQPHARDNPLDNELDDVNADGLLWQWRDPASRTGEWSSSAVHVPAPDGDARAMPMSGRSTPLVGGSIMPRVTWRPCADGWAMRLRWTRSTLPDDVTGRLAFELRVNERPAHRERRRGQLVLSGGGVVEYPAGQRATALHGVLLQLPPHPDQTTRR